MLTYWRSLINYDIVLIKKVSRCLVEKYFLPFHPSGRVASFAFQPCGRCADYTFWSSGRPVRIGFQPCGRCQPGFQPGGRTKPYSPWPWGVEKGRSERIHLVGVPRGGCGVRPEGHQLVCTNWMDSESYREPPLKRALKSDEEHYTCDL